VNLAIGEQIGTFSFFTSKETEAVLARVEKTFQFFRRLSVHQRAQALSNLAVTLRKNKDRRRKGNRCTEPASIKKTMITAPGQRRMTDAGGRSRIRHTVRAATAGPHAIVRIRRLAFQVLPDLRDDD
jgi:hypothetical protein